MTNYATLSSTTIDFAARSDLTAKVPTFIMLAENNIKRDVRTLNQQVRATLVVDETGMVALPDRYLGFRTVSLSPVLGGIYRDRQLDYMPPDKFAEFQGRDSFFSIEGGNLLLAPKPGVGATTSVDITYWQAYVALDDTTNTTNWLITNHFDIYFTATMAQIYSFLMDTESELLWTGKYKAAVESLAVHEGRKQRTGPKVRMPRVVT